MNNPTIKEFLVFPANTFLRVRVLGCRVREEQRQERRVQMEREREAAHKLRLLAGGEIEDTVLPNAATLLPAPKPITSDAFPDNLRGGECKRYRP